MHTNDVAQIAVPPEDHAEHVVEFGERHVIGDRDQADDHRAHMDLSSLLDRPTPDFLLLSFNRLGELRDRSFENQRYRASGLNLVVAAIVLWNTVY